MKARRIITIIWTTLLVGGSAFVALAVPGVAQDIARKTAEDAYGGNPYAMVLLVAVFGLAGVLWALNQAATIWAKVRGKETAPAIRDQLHRIEEKVDLLWDDMNQRRGAEKAKGAD